MGKLGWVLGAGLLGLGITSQGYCATALSLYSVNDSSLGPQSTSAPCIIAATQCQNPAGFDFTNFTQKGSVPAYDETSPLYTVADFPFLAFDVAIDVNTTSDAAETLLDFDVFVNGVLTWFYDGPTVIGGVSNNGNGYGDWGLTLIDLSGLASTDTVQFRANWNNASDGGESYFIVAREAPPQVPLPGTLGLLGLGLAGLGMVRRKHVA